MDSSIPLTIKRSLNIPVQSALPAPTVLSAYTQHPEVATLDQIMLHYLGMEEILILYSQNHEPFETRQTLNTLAIRFHLPSATTFKQLLRAYDMQYATVRSFLYNNRTPEEILCQAALEGDIQAMYNQLKLYPKLRKKYIYTQALKRAAEGGHRAIIDLLIELGADNVVILDGAAKGGHLSIFKEEVAKAVNKKYIRRLPLAHSARLAAANNRMEVLNYILSLNASESVLNDALEGAGISGNAATIEYLIAKGADDYAGLVEGATKGGHFDIFKQYYRRAEPGHLYLTLRIAMKRHRLDVVKFLFKHKLVDTDILVEALEALKLHYKNYVRQIDSPEKSPRKLAELVRKRDGAIPIIEYLERHVVNNEASSETSSD